jgi:hypothetical protein
MCWRILDYVTDRGENEIKEWINSLPAQAQAKIDQRIILLRTWPAKIWPPQYVSALRGYKDIYEFRVVSSGVQYRPLGCYGPAAREYTLLIGATEKGGRFQPPGVCETAVKRRAVILHDGSRVCDHEF